jgi:hypothetical protein
VASLVHTGEGEVAVFASLAVLHTVNEERRIAGGLELLAVLILGCEGDGLATEPVADVVGVTVNQGNAHGAGEDIFQILEEVGPDEVSGLLESKVDLVVRLGVVQVDAYGIQDRVLG